jgi:hypothetical protein
MFRIVRGEKRRGEERSVVDDEEGKDLTCNFIPELA